MALIIPTQLPARETLKQERVPIYSPGQSIPRPKSHLKVAILNLMPTKLATETQLLRQLGNSQALVEATFFYPNSHQTEHKNTDEAHLRTFYHPFDEIKDKFFDGVIITGAPVEQIPFEEVDYWDELCRIFDWADTHANATYSICWGAQAGLYHWFGIPKYPLAEKMFGVFLHRVLQPSPLFEGFDDLYYAPHSRHTEIRAEDVQNVPELDLLSTSDEAGVYIVATKDRRHTFVTGHGEYDPLTLQAEYQRDVSRNLPIAVPRHYYPQDDPSQAPLVRWRSHGRLLYNNWIKYCVALI